MVGKVDYGNLRHISIWLGTQIHQKGKLLSVPDLVKQVTGDVLNPNIFIDYLKNKYREIYRLN